MTHAEINQILAKYTELFALSLGAKPEAKGWTLAIGEDVVEIHGGFRRGQWTLQGETGNDLLALMAMRDGVPIKDVLPACLMFLAEQGEEISVPQAVREAPGPDRASHSEPGMPGHEPEPSRAKKPVSTSPENINRLLPQDADAEKGALSSFLLEPARVGRLCSEKRITKAHFHIPAHAIIFAELVYLWEERMPIDVITLTNHLRGAKQLDQVGGPAFVTDLFTFLPTAANVTYYLEIIEEKYTLREMIRVGTEYAARAYEEQSEVTILLDEFETKVGKIAVERYQTGLEIVDFKSLMDFDAKEDPDEVLGYRWLCRGGVGMWVGQSGIGKSAITMQSAMFWGMGQPLWGVKTSKGRRLKSLIIQAENDRGDMAEMAQGVMAGFGAANREEIIDTWNTQLVFARVTVETGKDFGRLADRLIRQHKPDLVWVDPLLSFVGGDLSKQEVASEFMRHIINPIAFDTGVVWMLLHHTGKPTNDPKAQSGWTDHDFAYQAFGSSELVNSARAVNVLRTMGNGTYELRFAKRGKRAGALTLPDDEGKQAFTDVLYLQHAKQGIYWEQAGQMTQEQIEQAKASQKKRRGTYDGGFLAESITERLETHSGIKPVALMKDVVEATGMSKPTFYRLIGAMKLEKKIVEKKGELFLALKPKTA